MGAALASTKWREPVYNPRRLIVLASSPQQQERLEQHREPQGCNADRDTHDRNGNQNGVHVHHPGSP